MAAKALAIVLWAVIGVCAIAGAVAAILYGNSNPSGTAEFNCALGVSDYCRQLQEAAQLHQLALYILLIAGLAGVVCLLGAISATIVAVSDNDQKAPAYRMPAAPPYPGYYGHSMPSTPPASMPPAIQTHSTAQPVAHVHPLVWFMLALGATLAVGVVLGLGAFVIARAAGVLP